MLPLTVQHFAWRNNVQTHDCASGKSWPVLVVQSRRSPSRSKRLRSVWRDNQILCLFAASLAKSTPGIRRWLLRKFADRQKRQGYGASAWSAFGRSPPPERDSPPILSPGACCFNGRIHREREAGCIVSWTTASSSSRN